jgi:hypothetical protein
VRDHIAQVAREAVAEGAGVQTIVGLTLRLQAAEAREAALRSVVEAAKLVDGGWYVLPSPTDEDELHLRYASDLPARLNTLRAALAATPEPGT